MLNSEVEIYNVQLVETIPLSLMFLNLTTIISVKLIAH